MYKKKKSQKQYFSLDDLPLTQIIDESKFHDSKASEFFKNQNEVAKILLECLIENDTESFIEILDTYKSLNKY